MEKTLRIAIACFVGAFIGGLIAIQLGTMGWWLGALIGAFIAYLGYNIEEVIAAIPNAWNNVSSWRPDTEVWVSKLKSGFGTMGLMQSIFIVLFAIQLSSSSLINEKLNELLVSIGILHVIGFMCGFILPGRNNSDKLINSPISFIHSNPIGVAFWMVWGVCWVLVRLPKIFRVTFEFVFLVVLPLLQEFTIQLFKMVHSELRLLCAVDAALGTAVGYFSGNALIGAVAGTILGVLNYEIVSVRIFKVAGAKSFIR